VGAAQYFMPLMKDGFLDLGQRRTGLEPEFVAQCAAGPAQRRQRVGLPVARP